MWRFLGIRADLRLPGTVDPSIVSSGGRFTYQLGSIGLVMVRRHVVAKFGMQCNYFQPKILVTFRSLQIRLPHLAQYNLIGSILGNFSQLKFIIHEEVIIFNVFF